MFTVDVPLKLLNNLLMFTEEMFQFDQINFSKQNKITNGQAQISEITIDTDI